jgi:hypothetical protein
MPNISINEKISLGLNSKKNSSFLAKYFFAKYIENDIEKSFI